jgi:EAL domain-containing protein (putative c-di-GMP-specific phosphodiesterase class I)
LNSGIEPGRFVFEVVESDQILDLGKLLMILDWFRDAGCRVALDDVGAGYNSLNLLTLVKPDFVKLDMELVRGVHRDPYKSCVARKLLELARELGVLTVAEGVETHEEWQWTRDHGADLAQGYLFAKPAPSPPTLDALGALLEITGLRSPSTDDREPGLANLVCERDTAR